jgi:hypothetical protein
VSCNAPIDIGMLAAHWLGELSEVEDDRISEHLLGCASCTEIALSIATVGSAFHAMIDQGTLRAAVTRAFVQRLVDDGFRTREYRLDPGGSVNCTIAPEDDLLVTRLAAPLAAGERVDLLVLDDHGEVIERLADLPFDHAAGEVLLASRAAQVKAMPETHFSMRLVTPGAMGDRTLSDYTFHHRPWPGH